MEGPLDHVDEVKLTTEPRYFFTTPRVLIGPGATAQVGQFLRSLGASVGTALLVTDVTLARLGVAARVGDLLASSGVEVVPYIEVDGEPTEDVADAVTSAARRSNAAAIVGLGGGSALDMAKLAAVMVTNPGRVADYFSGASFDTPPVPSVLLPTTAGTGAESSRYAVVSRGGYKASLGGPYLVPTGTVLDPELTLSLPPQITAWTGMDALSHCLESMLSTFSTPLTDAAAYRGAQLVRRYLPVAHHDSANLAARAQMQVAAFLGGLALNGAMVIGHSIAYTLARRLHLSHGLSCALALPHCIAYNADAAPDRVALIGQALGIDGEGAAVVREIAGLAASVGIPQAWQQLGLSRDDLPALVEECLTRYPRPNNPRPVERASLLRLYETAWEGPPCV